MIDSLARSPFAQQLGFELLSMADGEARIALALRPEHGNSFGVAHGGLTMTLLDVVMAHAARSVNPAPDFAPGVVTIEMKTSFLRPGQGRLLAHGKLLHRTATLAFCEGRVLGGSGAGDGDGDGVLCAYATGTFKFLRKLPAENRAVKPLRGIAR